VIHYNIKNCNTAQFWS